MRARLTLFLGLLLGACATRQACPPGELRIPSGSPRPAYAVVRSDASSASAIALLDAQGGLITADVIDSGSRVSSITTALSGDVVLPSTPLGDGVLALLDRLNVDVLTSIEAGGAVTQIDLRGPSEPRSGATVNPTDALRLPDGRLLVSRLQPSLDQDTPELGRGNDVVVVSEGAVAARISLDADTACTGESGCTAYARPYELLPLESAGTSRVLVTLGRLSLDFQRAGPGAVLTIDPVTLAPSAPLELAGLEDCWFAANDPGDPALAYVLCSGLTKAPEPERRAHAGIVAVRLGTDGSPAVEARYDPGESGIVPFGSIVAIGGGRVLFVAAPPAGDQLVELELASGHTRVVYTSAPFTLLDGVAGEGLALIPERVGTGRVLRLDTSGEAALVGETSFDDCIALPPIQIRRVVL